jgi:hypothetical protein
VSRILVLGLALLLGLAACGGDHPAGPSGHVIVIDIDDHGLSALWMANAPTLKGLISRGTLAFSHVEVPTHSNQNNMTLLTGQYPDGHDVPENAWLSRAAGFTAPVPLPGLPLGDYVLYDKNPLRTRGDSAYRAVRDAGGRSAFVGQLPPFDLGADDVHLAIVGATVGASTADATTAPALLHDLLGYPSDVVSQYHFDGPPAAGETEIRFTLRDAADLVRATGPGNPMPNYLFVWDFLALDDDPTSSFGADGPQLAAIVEDYDAGIGALLAALDDKGLTASTNILVTLDHGKVDAHKQVALGTQGGGGATPADGQLAAVVTAQGAALGLDTTSYALLNEDGDALLYARVDGAGTAAGAAAQTDLAHQLVSLVQSGALAGVDTTRTMTADGWLGTRRFHDFRASSPNQADVILYPQDDWTLNQVDATNTVPGLFQEHTQYPFGRHGGFSVDELYVPLIMAGPAFKSGVLLPHPVQHADVAPTALATLGLALRTAARGPIQAAFVGDPGETIALPSPPDGARDLVLAGSGFLGAVPPPPAPAITAVLIDLAGLYDDELFVDPKLADAAAPFRALAARGTRFEACWTRSRDWPVTEYQLLSGGYPLAPWFPAAEDDPAQTVAPGTGLLAMPPAPGFVADPAAYAAWRAASVFPQDSLFDAVGTRGLTGVLLGSPDFHALHFPPASFGIASSLAGGPLADELEAFARADPTLFAVIAVGGPRTADRHDSQAVAELAALAHSVDDLVSRVPNALVVITSRGATPIDDPGADFYGPGSSRHVPLVILGPGVRAGVVTGQPAAPADIPATILYALGAPTTTDFALGTWATGTPAQGVPQPLPAAATEGHALVRAFLPGGP